MKTLVLTAGDLRKLVDSVGLDALLERVLDRLQTGLAAVRSGDFEARPRSGFVDHKPATGLIEWMPGRDDQRTTVKIVGYHPDNPADSKPTILSVAASFENDTGHAVAFADATFLTALRTGAASAIAADVLAVADAETVGFIGCGAQAVSQLHALAKVRPIRSVLLSDADPRVEASFADRIAPLGLDVEVRRVPADEAAASADVLVTCTSVAPGHGPVFQPVEPRPGLHVNAVGSDFPGKTELPAEWLRRAFICADFPDQCLAEGECQSLTREDIGCDLAQLWCEAETFLPRRSQLTVFDSTGWALEDHFALDALVQEATRLGIGTQMEIEAVSNDPYDPYGFLELKRKPDPAPALARTRR